VYAAMLKSLRERTLTATLRSVRHASVPAGILKCLAVQLCADLCGNSDNSSNSSREDAPTGQLRQFTSSKGPLSLVTSW